jgi:hypothetical protein
MRHYETTTVVYATEKKQFTRRLIVKFLPNPSILRKPEDAYELGNLSVSLCKPVTMALTQSRVVEIGGGCFQLDDAR